MNSRALFVAGMIYKDIVKPITIWSTVTSVYTYGYIDGIDYIFGGKKKAFHEKMWGITTSAAGGFCCGVTFPISMPLLGIYNIYRCVKNDKS